MDTVILKCTELTERSVALMHDRMLIMLPAGLLAKRGLPECLHGKVRWSGSIKSNV